MNKKIMVVGAHADDVELHFGGTVFKYLDKGYELVYVMATNNMSGSQRFVNPDGTLTSKCQDTVVTEAFRKSEATEAAKLFNTTPIHLDHPQRHYHDKDENGELRQYEVRYGCHRPSNVPEDVPTILTAHEDLASVERLADLIVNVDPEAVFTHGYGEVNPEHHCTMLLVMKARKLAAERGYGGNLLAGVRQFTDLGRFACCWETWVDITGYFDRRMAAVRKHVSQYPPEFSHGADYWREIAERKGKACGVPMAETFNFINDPDEASAEGELTEELLRNRADKKPWGL